MTRTAMTMCRARAPEMRGSRVSRGGRCMTSGSDGSTPSANARVTAVTILTHRICSVVNGSCSPIVMATTMVSACAQLVASVNAMPLRRLS